jgi:hypothetical protein
MKKRWLASWLKLTPTSNKTSWPKKPKPKPMLNLTYLVSNIPSRSKTNVAKTMPPKPQMRWYISH